MIHKHMYHANKYIFYSFKVIVTIKRAIRAIKGVIIYKASWMTYIPRIRPGMLHLMHTVSGL